MEVGIFDVLVEDIFYHLWNITFQCRTLSQNRLSIHSIEKLPVNVAKRSFYHNMQPGFVNYLCALPRCYWIRSWTEHAVVKAEEYTANNGGGVFQYIIISITCESFLFAVDRILSQNHSRSLSIEKLPVNVAYLPYRFAFESVPEPKTQLWKRRRANNGDGNIQ